MAAWTLTTTVATAAPVILINVLHHAIALLFVEKAGKQQGDRGRIALNQQPIHAPVWSIETDPFGFGRCHWCGGAVGRCYDSYYNDPERDNCLVEGGVLYSDVGSCIGIDGSCLDLEIACAPLVRFIGHFHFVPTQLFFLQLPFLFF